MKSFHISISCLILALIFSASFAQDAQTTPLYDQHSIPAIPVDHSDPSQPISGNMGQSAQPIVVNTNQIQPESGATFQPESGTPNHQQPKAEDTSKISYKPEDNKMKETIRKMLSQMTDEEIEEFEKQLAGDARKYYDQLRKEEEQKQVEEEKWEEEEIQEMEEEKQLTPSEIQSKKEQDDFEKDWDRFSDKEISYHEYLFELEKAGSEDFRFTIPVAQQVTFYGYTYENKDGVYSVPKDIEGQQPIWVYVYENNNRIVFQKQFQFKYFGHFQGNQNSTYLIRFVNPSSHKLIAFNLAVLFEVGHSADKLTAVDVADHSRRIKISKEQVANRYNDISTRQVMEYENRGELMNKLDRYFAYSIVQILIIAVLCVMQVEFVRKLLASTSVV